MSPSISSAAPHSAVATPTCSSSVQVESALAVIDVNTRIPQVLRAVQQAGVQRFCDIPMPVESRVAGRDVESRAAVCTGDGGAARASVDLLRVAAALTLAVPLTTLTAATLPSLEIWAHTTPDALAVDFVALAMGLAFTAMARKTARLVYEGRSDSIWSVRPSIADARANAHEAAAE